MVEQAELERLQQRHLREYSPELAAMTRLQNSIADVLARKDLSPEDKLSLLANYQGRFKNLQSETGVGTTKPTTGAVVMPTVSGTEEKPVPEEEEEQYEEAEDQADSDEGKPNVIDVDKVARQLGVEPMYQKKAARLLMKILARPEILSSNPNGEVVYKGAAIANSNFGRALRTLVGSKNEMDQPGLSAFLAGLKHLGVQSGELSGKEIQELYSPKAPPPPTLRQSSTTKRSRTQSIW